MTLEEWIETRGIDRIAVAERAAVAQMTEPEIELWLELRRERDAWRAMIGSPESRYELFLESFGVEVGSASDQGSRRHGRG